jgi:hypothetical protein
MEPSQIQAAISQLSDQHILKRSPTSYIDSFVSAVCRTYPGPNLGDILQNKFFIPNDSNYTNDGFLQSASELSVANHINLKSTFGFETEKNVNPTNNSDVDVYFELSTTKVSVEVKCPVEVDQSKLGDLVLKTAGRLPDFRSKLQELERTLEGSNSRPKVIQGKNKDLTHKDFLLSAQSKFNPESSVDQHQLNILFIACGYYFNINEWYLHLYGSEGLFTDRPFHSPSEFRNVDVVILSNLKYCHQHARQFHDWTLRDAFLLPFVNPHGRPSFNSDAVRAGLSVFDHHLDEFESFVSDGSPEFIFAVQKVNHYVGGHLDSTRRDRFFPVELTT